MTTSVTVKAHCDENTKVRIILGNRDNDEKEEILLADGEGVSHAVYDSKYISVDEIPKE
jgi:hypothetical protein